MSKSPSIQSPVRIGAIWSSEPISSFSNLCIKSVVANAFDFTQVREFPPGWAVSLSFGFSTLGGSGEQFSVTLPGPFYSKKEAKAAAAVQGLKVLTEALAKKNNGDIRGDFDCNGDGGENENWIGLLGGIYIYHHCLRIHTDCFLTSGFIRILPGQPKDFTSVSRIRTWFRFFDGSHDI